MKGLLKSTALAAGLLTAVIATAHAQSVSSLPPTSPETAPTSTETPAVSSAKIAPNPGNSGAWQTEHYTAVPADNDPARHPYSTPHFAPAPN